MNIFILYWSRCALLDVLCCFGFHRDIFNALSKSATSLGSIEASSPLYGSNEDSPYQQQQAHTADSAGEVDGFKVGNKKSKKTRKGSKPTTLNPKKCVLIKFTALILTSIDYHH
jgi:hypothetical protein